MPESLDFTIVKFKSKDLKRIPEIIRGYIIASSHAINQINSIRIYHIFEDTRNVSKYPERSIVSVRQMCLLNYGLSSIIEFNKLTNKFLVKYKLMYPASSENLRKEYKIIAKKISSIPISERVRNKATFHFDIDEPNALLERISDNQELNFTFGHNKGSISYLFAEEIYHSNIAFEMSPKMLQHGSDNLWACYIEIFGMIMNFQSKFMMKILDQYGLFKRREPAKLDPPSLGIHGEVFIPIVPATANERKKSK